MVSEELSRSGSWTTCDIEREVELVGPIGVIVDDCIDGSSRERGLKCNGRVNDKFGCDKVGSIDEGKRKCLLYFDYMIPNQSPRHHTDF